LQRKDTGSGAGCQYYMKELSDEGMDSSVGYSPE